MQKKYQQAQELAQKLFYSRIFSLEELQTMSSVSELNKDSMIYVLAWLKGIALAYKSIMELQKEMR